MTTVHAVGHTPVSFAVAGDRFAGVLYVPTSGLRRLRVRWWAPDHQAGVTHPAP